MLFNSYLFILLYLPATFAGMILLGRFSHRLGALWLATASLVFYAAWDARFVALLLASILFNYTAGYLITLRPAPLGQGKVMLAIAITANLALLGFFKYANFFLATFNAVSGQPFSLLDIVLPLGISFFTFTQIAFLVDAYRGIARERDFVHYLLFVTYFPHLIAGPVLHHKQMMPQFAQRDTYRFNPDNFTAGVTIFILGLSKKVLLADHLAQYATPIFDAVANGGTPMFIEAWIGALTYTLQLYFDFSGYSDMAIGLSLMFNIRLPLNFNSPYKSHNIIDFWRRWHITLSTFLRDYLYFPLGGNRKGLSRRYLNLLVTMLLGGLWHGAGWTFILWGGLHGFYLVINHAWRSLLLHANLGRLQAHRAYIALSASLTFIAVVIGWVFFRADNLSSALSFLQGMSGMHGLTLPYYFESLLTAHNIALRNVSFGEALPLTNQGITGALLFLLAGFCIVWFMPNLREIMYRCRPTWEDITPVAALGQTNHATRLAWQPNRYFAWLCGILFALSLLSLSQPSEFLYFQF